MEELETTDFFREMNLTRAEIATLERFIDLVEMVKKGDVRFFKGDGKVATDATVLYVEGANFLQDVYQIYAAEGSASVRKNLQNHFKDFINRLSRIEKMSDDSPALDTYTRIKRDLAIEKKY